MSEPVKPSNRMKNHETILATAGGGMAIAMSTVLSMIKLYEMPQGGSITPASLLPIFFCALAFGPAWGMGIGAVYGLLQFIISPYAAHWASIILDYPLAFALIGLAGFFAAGHPARLAEQNVLRRLGLIPVWRVIVAIVAGAAGRFAASFVSGMIFYGSYAPEGQSAAIYSLIYNASYILPDMVVILIVLIPLAMIINGRPKTA